MTEQNWLDKDDWFEELVRRAKGIESNIVLDIWKRYGECGKLLIEVGYKHSLDARGFLKNFMEAMGIKSRATITTMLQVGRMSDAELADNISKYGTIFGFGHKLPLTTDVKQYRLEHKKPPKGEQCEQGLECFPHCCPMCPYYKKVKVV